ncbi:amino acid adenylation domain-containing protein [Streptomyces sp. NPDC092296]|uniref:amino acid adenylation domain-containing protein n=1 Tax=Streptomyces sp. NPDC092296 TaxID=3366012 RepID=UPI003816E739
MNPSTVNPSTVNPSTVNPSTELSPLPLAEGAVERARALSLGHRLSTETGHGVLTRVEQAAARAPEQPAVVDGDTALTYRDLLARVVRIAAALEAAGCRSGEVVAAVGDRCADSVAVFLALERLGAVYLPVDPDWPTGRVADVLRRGGAGRLLHYGPDRSRGSEPVRAATEAGLPTLTAPPADPPADPAAAPDGTPPTAAERDRSLETRYCIFTSGTTGRPKGAAVEHRGMMNHLWAKVRDLSLTATDRLAFTAPLVFDISIWQMLAPLLVGGTVVVVRQDELSFPRRLVRFLERSAVTVVEAVPTVVGWFAGEAERRSTPVLPGLRWLISTGEELHPDLAGRMLDAAPHARLLNAYGPTECSDDVTHHEVTRADLGLGRLPVGAPIANAALYLLVRTEDGARWRAAEPGEAGELFVGGLVVGRGYVNDPDNSRAAFHPDVLDPDSPTGRLYRTGDLARFERGSVHYLGRVDRQVKVAGTRMELDEIEVVLGRHPAVDQCAVTVLDVDGRPELAAYVTLRRPVDTDELRAALADALPRAMVPQRLVRLDAMPLTRNGKIDHRALRDTTPPGRESRPGDGRATPTADTPGKGSTMPSQTTADTSAIDDLPPHFRLLLELARPRLSARRTAEVRRLASLPDLSWGDLLEAAARHKVLPLIGRHVDRYRLDRKQGDTAGFPYPWVFVSAYLGNRVRNQALSDEFGRVFDELRAAGLRFAVRKGFSLGEGEYHDPALRRIADLDVLLARADAPAAHEVLTRLGYVQGSLADDGERIEPYSRETQLFWRMNLSNQLPYRRAAGRPDVTDFNVDICHDIFQKKSGVSADAAELLDRVVPTVLCGTRAWVPAPDDRLLDLCSHLHKEATSLHFVEDKQDLQLSKFLDLSLVAAAFDDAQWERFLGRVREYGAESIVYYALHFTTLLYPRSVPARVLDAVRPADTGYLEEYGTLDGQTARWEEGFFQRLFDSGRHRAGTVSNVPLR